MEERRDRFARTAGIPRRVVVIGGGLSGLVAASMIHEGARSLNRDVEVLVLEAKDTIGGVIRTERRDGFILEAGPDSFITNKPWGIDLCVRLGLTDQLVEMDSTHKRSFVVRNGKLMHVPEGFVLMAPHRVLPILTSPILSWRGKLRILMDLVIPRRDGDADESLASFVRRRLGREALERLVQPLVGGLYAGDPNDLSLKATLPQYLAMERDHGGLIRAAWHRTAPDQRRLFDEDTGARFGTFVTLAEGMETLPRALAATLPPQSIRLNSPARRISRNASATGWTVELLNGAAFEADAVIVTTEAHATARLFEATDPSLALQLRGIPYASSVILNMAYRREDLQHPLDGLGIFAPLIENRSFLATSFSSVKFPNRAPEGTVMLRTFIGGPMQAELCQLEDQALSDLVARDLGQLIGAKAPPLFQQISRHPRAMPQYVLGHLDSVGAIRKRIERHPGLFLTGIAFDGVGIPDCIRGAQKTASDVLNSLFNSSVAAA